MSIVIDTNIILSALIKAGKTREIIFKNYVDFVTPAYALTEVEKYKKDICKKSRLSLNELEMLISLLFRYIRIMNPYSYNYFLEKASEMIEDKKEVPFIATALALNCPIWSDDKHFKKQKEIKVFTTKEILDVLKNG